MLTPEQQQVVIVWLIVVAAVVVLLALAGGVMWYLVFTKGFTPFALVLLLPILWVTAIFMPLIWLFGASIQHWQEAHEASGRSRSPLPLSDEVSAATPQPHQAPAIGGSRRATSPELGPAGRAPIPTA